MIDHKYLAAAREAALQAGEILRENMDSVREISYKGAIDIVTNYDRISQQKIFDILASHFPEHDFLAEEDLCEEKGSPYRWIIDPIDGTTNFAHTFPVFCVSIALEKNGEILVGVIYDPVRDELFSAVKDQGASLNGHTVRVSKADDLDKSLLSTGFPYDIRESKQNNLDHFVNFATRSQAVRRLGSAAIDLCYVACGRFDGFWEIKLNPWDVAAGALIVSEAGGWVTDFSGNKCSIYGAEILASNGLIHDQMQAVLLLRQNNSREHREPE